MMQLYCSQYLITAYRLYSRWMSLCYANPPFSQLPKVLTIIAIEGARVVLCTSELGSLGEHCYGRRFLDPMAVGPTELPKRQNYVPEDSQETMPLPEWGSLLSIADESPNLQTVCDLTKKC